MHPRCGGLPVLEDNEFRNWSVNTLVIDPINTNALSQKACLIHAANILFQHCTSRQAWFVILYVFVLSCIEFYLSSNNLIYYYYSVCHIWHQPRRFTGRVLRVEVKPQVFGHESRSSLKSFASSYTSLHLKIVHCCIVAFPHISFYGLNPNNA